MIELTPDELQDYSEELSLIVHGLKEPLAAILADAELLDDDASSDPGRHAALMRIRGSAKAALETVINLLDLTVVEPGRPVSRRTAASPSLMLAVLAERRKTTARNRRIAMKLGARCEREIDIDVDLVARVVDNILDNAFRYTPEGGRIELAAIDHGDRIRIEVGNTGPTIPAEFRERVFSKYGQTEVAPWRINLGVGLYFSRLAIEALGGAMRVDSSPELPTLFVIEIPVAGSA